MEAMVSVEAVDGDALATCQAIRRTVFVEGQGVPEALEIDGLDPDCAHFLARAGGRPVGTARLRELDGRAKAERVAVLAAHRRDGVGRALMRALEGEARRRGHRELVLNAQEEVVPFYELLGYTICGARFDEAGIPHRPMTKGLR
ncbi:MAG: GNAT family N-acetyltransferase [Myxococcota bacterium]|nr:GNAT family N-acetyltransferase [Myxococcota bacterium]